VRKALRSQEVYRNFLRCLKLFDRDVVTLPQLVLMASSFLGNHPELFRSDAVLGGIN
jgi:paired amphipathic helix protein Sin3a